MSWEATKGSDMESGVHANGNTPAARRRAHALEEALKRTIRLREPLAIFIADSESWGEREPADIGLVWPEPGEAAAYVDILIPGPEGTLRRVASDVAAGEVAARLTRLVRTYTVERCRQDTFASWAAGLGEGDLAERLGLPGSGPGARNEVTGRGAMAATSVGK